MTAEPSYSYLYDAESRACAVESTLVPGMTQMTGYLYDASGARIAKGTLSTFSCDRPQNGFQPTEQYILGPSGENLTMLDGSGNWQRTNIYGGGALLVTPISVKRDEQPNPASPNSRSAAFNESQTSCLRPSSKAESCRAPSEIHRHGRE